VRTFRHVTSGEVMNVSEHQSVLDVLIASPSWEETTPEAAASEPATIEKAPEAATVATLVEPGATVQKPAARRSTAKK